MQLGLYNNCGSYAQVFLTNKIMPVLNFTRILLLAVLSLYGAAASAQIVKQNSARDLLGGFDVSVSAAASKTTSTCDERVFTSVQQMPRFPDGDAALMKYLAQHLQYPETAAKNGTQGNVIVQFVVTKTGEIGEVKVVRSLSADCDIEAKRVVESLPNFIPGRQNGQAVNVWYTLPITFKLPQ